MNKIIITGRITKDTELKVTDSGKEYCNFSVAVDRRFKNKDVESEKHTDFFDCTAWGKSGAFVDKYFGKGDGITVEGRMESRKYTDKDGNNRVFWGVTCENIEFPLGNKKGGGSDETEPNGTAADGSATFTPVEGGENGEDGKLPF